MIKAIDLRKGNIVTQDGELINGITTNSIHKFDLGQIELKGIPLTEEWLLKSGWIWNEECKSFEFTDARMNLQYRDISSSYTMFNYVLKALIADRIYYVHQLQNLYFCLCGKELTFKR